MRLRTLAAMGLLLLAAGRAEAQTFSLTDLGAHTPAGESRGFGINSGGQVVGSAQDGSGNFKAFLWGAGTMKNLGAPKGYYFSTGAGTNNRGDVVGWGGKSTSSALQSLMWLEGGSAQTVVVVSGGRQSQAHAINDARQIVGAIALSDGVHAFLSTVVGGKRKTLDLGLGTGVAINASGQVLIWDGSPAHSYSLWTPGQPNGVTGSRFWLGAGGHGAQNGALNDKGQVVFGRTLWVPQDDPETGLTAGFYDLGVLQEPTSTQDFMCASGINNRGQVVGYQRIVTSWDAHGNPATSDARPFLWDPQGGMRSLQVEAASGNGWRLVSSAGGDGLHALAINDPLPGETYGQIACTAFNSSGTRRAILLKPTAAN